MRNKTQLGFKILKGLYQTMSIRPSLRGPGYECEPAFPQKSEELTAASVIDFRNSEYEFDDREDLRWFEYLHQWSRGCK